MLGLHRLLRRWHARKGRLVVLPSVPSPELDNRRDLYIYVPAAPARSPSHRDRRVLHGRADQPVRLLPVLRELRLRGRAQSLPLVRRWRPPRPRGPGAAGAGRGPAVLRHRDARGSADRGARTPVARPAAREGLRWGARLSLGGGQGRRAPRVGVGPSLPRGPPVPAAGSGDVKPAHHKWYSPALGRDMELQVLGHAGARVLVFPTSLGSYSEWTDRRMDRPGVLGEHLEN